MNDVKDWIERIEKDERDWREDWDSLVWKAVFGEEKEKALARWIIWEVGQEIGVRPASINDLYMATGRGELEKEFTVPAINLRGMAYDMARAVFATALKLEVGGLICELARSEMGYTDQPPREYASVVMAAAIREGWRGPLFIQGDHFQTKTSSSGVVKEGEVESIKELISKSIEAGFYNIDIDTSTLVDLKEENVRDQQKVNIETSLELVKYVRKVEPEGLTVSLGGEIGHIGGKNSTVEEFETYMDGFNEGLDESLVGMSKISVQTGTSHGGVVLEDGSLAEVDVDFSVLEDISEVGKEKYGIGGAVQHGASTLPNEFFSQFPKHQALEVHLATGFQNIMMDHREFPKALLREIYEWLNQNEQDERKEGQSDEQFHYKLRKKSWGEFKRRCWEIDEGIKEKLRSALEERFEFMFKALRVDGTMEEVMKIVEMPELHKDVDDFFGGSKVVEVKGLAD